MRSRCRPPWLRGVVFLGLALGALATGCDTGGSTVPGVSPSPAPTWVVGVTTRTWVDSTRPTPANGSAPAQATRTLVTDVWYPVTRTSPGDGGAVTEEVRDATADTTQAHPLVLFVHGSSGSRRQSVFLTRALASAGYVVAAADFPLTAGNTPGGPSDLHVDQQPGDLAFLADRLTAATADPADTLAHTVDTTGYAVVGHSTGGTVALVAAYGDAATHDPRVQAVAALAPCACFFREGFFQTRGVPMMVVGGTDDLFVPLATNGQRAFTLARPPRWFARLVGGNHLYFTDVGVITDAQLSPVPTTSHDDIATALAAYGGGTACEPAPAAGSDPPMPFERQHTLTVALVQAFLDARMRGQGAALAALAAHPDPDVTIAR